MREEECPNCGHITEVELWEDGHCGHCGLEYYWREWNVYDEDDEEDEEVVLIWEDTFADIPEEEN